MTFRLAFCLLLAASFATANLFADEKPVAEVDEKTKEFLAGEWESQEKSKAPLIFEKDGKFTFGVFQENGKWVLGKGTWTVGDDGRVRARATSRGATFGLWYRIVGEELHAPMGPNPNVVWKKKVKKEEEKRRSDGGDR